MCDMNLQATRTVSVPTSGEPSEVDVCGLADGAGRGEGHGCPKEQNKNRCFVKKRGTIPVLRNPVLAERSQCRSCASRLRRCIRRDEELSIAFAETRSTASSRPHAVDSPTGRPGGQGVAAAMRAAGLRKPWTKLCSPANENIGL